MFLGVRLNCLLLAAGVFLKMLHVSSVSSFSTQGFSSGGSKDGRWGGAASSISPSPFFFLTWALEVSRGLYCPVGPLLEGREEREQKSCPVEGGGRMLTGFELTPIPRRAPTHRLISNDPNSPVLYAIPFVVGLGCSGTEKLFLMTRSLK